MPTTTVQRRLDEAGSIALPGVFDALSARIAEQAGFPLAFVSGYSVAATMIGEPDLGLLTQTEVVERARQICSRVAMPILVDADTGYGGPINVHRTVKQLIAAGAKGCFLEDQVWPKKCGHMRDKQVIPRAEYVEKIRSAVDARGDADFFIVARTDALAVVDLEEAIARVTVARAAGADASFVEAPESRETLAAIGKRSPAPNVANMIAGGRTPVLTAGELADLGFHVILHPLAGLFAAAAAIEATYDQLKTAGSLTEPQTGLMDFDRFNELIGVAEKHALAERFRAL